MGAGKAAGFAAGTRWARLAGGAMALLPAFEGESMEGWGGTRGGGLDIGAGGAAPAAAVEEEEEEEEEEAKEELAVVVP